MKKIGIWGAGDLGELVVKQIQVYFKEWEIVSIMDTNLQLAGKVINHVTVCPPDYGMSREIELLILCSNQYKEMAEQAVLKYGFPKEQMIFVETIWPCGGGVQMLPRIRWEKLTFKSFINNSASFSEIVKDLKSQEGKLNELGIECGTDKASIIVFDNGFRLAHDYLRHYEALFYNLREKMPVICELGCGNGASLKMWKRYFQHAQIIGVDINLKAKKFEEDRVEIVLGNAAHEETLNALKNKYKKFTVIIDDASHAWGDMRTSFEGLWEALERGGFYVLEDVQCGSGGAFPQYPPVVYDAQSIFDYVLDRAKIMNFGRDWNPEYNTYHFEHLPERIRKIESELDSVVIIHGTCIIKKR